MSYTELDTSMTSMISVIIPVYNMGKYLPRAIDTLLKQTYSNFEVIIVDDGSTDGSSRICDLQSNKDERLYVVHKENGGLSSARNCGIESAEGEFIIFLDPDDWVDPAYLENLIKIHNKYGSDIEICAHYISFDSYDEARVLSADDCLYKRTEALDILMNMSGYCGYSWNKMFHMDRIRSGNLRFDTELGTIQDLHFAYRYMCVCDKVAYSAQPTYHYYQESDGITQQMELTPRKMSGLQAYVKIAELSRDKYPNVEQAAYASIYGLSLLFLFLYYESHCNDKIIYRQLRSNINEYKIYFHHSVSLNHKWKLLGRIAEFNPWLSYFVRKTYQTIRRCFRKTKPIGK